MKCEQLNALKGEIYFFEVMKEIHSGKRTTGWSVYDTKGNLITDKDSILRVLENFYSNLFEINKLNFYDFIKNQKFYYNYEIHS